MNTWKVILATLVIFGAGVITGGLLVNSLTGTSRHPRKLLLGESQTKATLPAALGSNVLREAQVPLPANVLSGKDKDFLERLNRELKLTPEQRGRIEKIICEGQQRIKECRKKIEPEVQLELSETRQKIRGQLTPAQQNLFNELLKRHPSNSPHAATNSPAAAPTNQPAK